MRFFFLTILVSFILQFVMSEDTIKCWLVFTNIDGTKEYYGWYEGDNACPYQIDFSIPLDLLTYYPEDYITAAWVVNETPLEEDPSIKQMVKPKMSSATISTYLRSCSSIEACDALSSPLSQSETIQGELNTKQQFQSVKQVQLGDEGTYIISAQIEIVDPESPSYSYVFATFTSIDVQAFRSGDHDQISTNCWRSKQSPLDILINPSAREADGIDCGVHLKIEIPEIGQPDGNVTVEWQAQIMRDSTNAVTVPEPLDTAFVDSNVYEIVQSKIYICDEMECDYDSILFEKDGSQNMDIENMGLDSGPANFSNDVAKFQTKGLQLPSTVGEHKALAHVVLVAGDDSDIRLDFVKSFPLIVTNSDISKSLEQNLTSTLPGLMYCWEVAADAEKENITTKNVLSLTGTSRQCPYLLTPAASEFRLEEGDTMDLEYEVVRQKNGDFDGNMFSDIDHGNSTIDGTPMEVAQFHVYQCPDSNPVGLACTPFSSNLTNLAFAKPSNFSNGNAIFTFNDVQNKLTGQGNVTLMAHVVISSGDYRVDVISYSAVMREIIAEEKGTSVWAYVAVVGGCILLGCIVFITQLIVRRYRWEQRRKAMAKSGLFGFGDMESPSDGWTIQTLADSKANSSKAHDSDDFVYRNAGQSEYQSRSESQGRIEYQSRARQPSRVEYQNAPARAPPPILMADPNDSDNDDVISFDPSFQESNDPLSVRSEKYSFRFTEESADGFQV